MPADRYCGGWVGSNRGPWESKDEPKTDLGCEIEDWIPREMKATQTHKWSQSCGINFLTGKCLIAALSLNLYLLILLMYENGTQRHVFQSQKLWDQGFRTQHICFSVFWIHRLSVIHQSLEDYWPKPWALKKGITSEIAGVATNGWSSLRSMIWGWALQGPET